MEGGSILFVITMIAIYFLPSIVAVARNHHNGAGISILNLFLGWTLIGWVVALVWSVSSSVPQSPEINTKVNISAREPESRSPKRYTEIKKYRICPHCNQPIPDGAVQCRECGATIGWSRDKGAEVLTPFVSRLPEPPKIDTEQNEDKVCPDCAETIKAAAKVCRYCGYRFEG